MTKHTPGPWHRNIKPASRYPVIFAGRNTHVAQVCTNGLSEEEIEANCNLLYNAPDLLAALEAVTNHLTDVMRGPMIVGQGITFHNGIPTIKAARAAIAKATLLG